MINFLMVYFVYGFVVILWDLYSRFLSFHLEAHVKISEGWKSLHFVVIFVFFPSNFVFFSFRLWLFKTIPFIDFWRRWLRSRTRHKQGITCCCLLYNESKHISSMETFFSVCTFMQQCCCSSWSRTNESVLNSDLFTSDTFITLMFPGILMHNILSKIQRLFGSVSCNCIFKTGSWTFL